MLLSRAIPIKRIMQNMASGTLDILTKAPSLTFGNGNGGAYGRDFPITGRRSTSSQAGGANIAVIYSRWPSQDNQDFHF
jgi:hypothetical protein